MLDEEIGMQWGKNNGWREKSKKEKMKWVLFRLQAEKK